MALSLVRCKSIDCPKTLVIKEPAEKRKGKAKEQSHEPPVFEYHEDELRDEALRRYITDGYEEFTVFECLISECIGSDSAKDVSWYLNVFGGQVKPEEIRNIAREIFHALGMGLEYRDQWSLSKP